MATQAEENENSQREFVNPPRGFEKSARGFENPPRGFWKLGHADFGKLAMRVFHKTRRSLWQLS